MLHSYFAITSHQASACEVFIPLFYWASPRSDQDEMHSQTLLCLAFATILCRAATGTSGSATNTPSSSDGVYATYHNNLDDLLQGRDGIPIHPVDYQASGKLATAVDQDGNGLEQAEAHLSYFEGRYYLYSATWACGKFVYSRIAGFGNINATAQGSPPTPIKPRGSAPVACGIKTYSSPDMTSWKLQDFYVPPDPTITLTKPVVRYSNATGQYVMLLGNQQLTDLAYLVSESPAGPFTGPTSAAPGVLSGPNIGHDFDVAVGPDGTSWLLTDTRSNATLPTDGSAKYPTTVAIAWDLVVQKFNPDLTSVPAQSNDTFRIVRTGAELAALGLSLEACSFFAHDGYYYMMFGQTCQNCAGYVYYLYSKGDPLGPYTDGGFLSMHGCGAQNKGASVLPAAQGEVVLAGALAYRTSPTSQTLNGVVAHANNNQALSQTLYYPLEFNANHTIKPWTCPASVRIPLAANTTTSPRDPGRYQLDCRVRNWQSIEVTFDPPRDAKNISFPVYQRNDDVSGAFTPAIIDGDLKITLQYDDGSNSSRVLRPLDVSWAPTKISIVPAKGKVAKMLLSTNATTGCFGYIVQPKTDAGGSLSSMDVYGNRKDTPKAQVYFHSF
ncbi:hypothetical protein MAPG_05977 [Magnaporthiopsis poae ATCC 64411]|uniref:Glycosyl hydrolase family 43 protein n=1 Tax=Magnaporthiopsis poae (strain ATCC 64411 / 73-15) TaxID=644358 RepID=A0A0C4E0U0_MAGP6|nr:hypothetical protein MAPG_05977 [Magnaporthiopsis poae ATCC 64411]